MNTRTIISVSVPIGEQARALHRMSKFTHVSLFSCESSVETRLSYCR